MSGHKYFGIGETIFKEGEWELQRKDTTPTGYQLVHDCNISVGNATRWRYSDFDWNCSWCNSEIPESLKTLYVLLTSDLNLDQT